MNREKRAAKRLNLSTLNLFNLCLGDEPCFPATVRNVSVSGMLVEFYFEDPPEEVQPGLELAVRDVPPELKEAVAAMDDVLLEPCPESLGPMLCGRKAELVWSSGRLGGLRFLEPLTVSTEELEKVLAQYGIPAWLESILEQGPQVVDDQEVAAWAKAEQEADESASLLDDPPVVDSDRVPPEK
jgi:hypothetical protein